MARIMAHRGASADLPEHTRAAFERALAVGTDGIECDVHLTADREVVCLHDDTVDRTSNGSGAVAGYTLAQLRALDWGSWRPVVGSLIVGEPVSAHQLVTLEELLDLMLDADRPLDLAIETKHPSPFGHELEDAVLAVLQRVAARRPLDLVRVRIITFSAAAIEHLRVKAPEMMTEYLAEQWTEELIAGIVPAGATAFGPSIQMLSSQPQWAIQLRDAGIEIHPWTVDDPDDARAAAELRCSIITTNRPEEIRAAIA